MLLARLDSISHVFEVDKQVLSVIRYVRNLLSTLLQKFCLCFVSEYGENLLHSCTQCVV